MQEEKQICGGLLNIEIDFTTSMSLSLLEALRVYWGSITGFSCSYSGSLGKSSISFSHYCLPLRLVSSLSLGK